MKYSHLFLKNRSGVIDYVYTIRNIPQREKNEEEEEVFVKDYSHQKDKLKKNLDIFKRERVERKTRRTFDLPFHLEYIEIRFFNQFNKDYGRTDRYRREFGLRPVSYTDFNKTVLFYIENERLFSRFVNLVEQFINSQEREDPSNQNYHVITFIHSFEFLSSRKIIKTSGERIIVSLTDKLKDTGEWETTREKLLAYIEERDGNYSEIAEGVLEIANANDLIDEIADNFDVIQKIQSIPPVRVTPGAFGTPKFEWDFETVPNMNLPIVGIIDTGIDDNVTPLQPLIIGQTSILDEGRGIGSGHGTNVASLMAFGKDLLSDENPKNATANLYSIQVVYSEEGTFSYAKLRDTIIQAHREYNIRIFNLSVCGKYSFEYNAGFSAYAKMLDELAYTYDLLIFIATGNLEEDYIDFMKEELGPHTHLINYPNHYYNERDNNYSQPTNIGSPAESMNNITVGAIACNNIDNTTDLTTHHTLPAYYSRKYHVDYAQEINGSGFNKNQKNKHIFKPDILMPGGDWLDNNSKMIVLGRGYIPSDFYIRLSGSSLATPLAANLAAKIISMYPNLNMQSVKALIINSAEPTKVERIISGIIDRCKEIESQNVYGRTFNHLSKSEKMKISTKFSSKRLARYIEGHGVPDEDKCLNSTNKRVTFIIEDHIRTKHHHVKHIKLPAYLSRSQKHNVLKITATLCFKFPPVKDDAIAYNPIHISFNILNAQRDSQETAVVIANRRDKNRTPLIPIEEQKDRLRIKSSFPWSEDFGYINRQLLSNTQKIAFTINREDLTNINHEFAVAIRCLGKQNYVDESIENPYSLVISIEEYNDIGLDGYDLYQEISAINEVENIMELDTELDIMNLFIY